MIIGELRLGPLDVDVRGHSWLYHCFLFSSLYTVYFGASQGEHLVGLLFDISLHCLSI